MLEDADIIENDLENGYSHSQPITDDTIRRNLLDDADRAWTPENVQRVRTRRAAMSGTLFFDILLTLGGIQNPEHIFPPSNKDQYGILLDAIFASSYDNMKRDCLIYYLLKYLMNTSEVGFANQQMLTQHYASIADAYWYLDNGFNLDNAITHLSDARIIKEYSSKIMDTLALDAEGDRLIRRFVRTCFPSLKESSDMTRYMLALADQSVVEAWEYQQRFPNSLPAKKDLIRSLLSWVLLPKPKQEPLKLLLSMQMSGYEEAVVRDFSERPPEGLTTQATGIIRDMVCVRLILQCKYVDAVKFDRVYPSSGAAPRGTWGTERERIIKEIIAILPAVERRLLESELENMDENVPPPTTTSSGASWTNVGAHASSSTADLSASWEDVGKRIPRRSIGRPISGRTPRSSLANGLAASNESLNAGARSQPLSAYSTLVSNSSSAPHMSSFNSQPNVPIATSASGPAKLSVNGNAQPKTNGASRTNAFMARNAFYEPPVERSSSPDLDANIRLSRSPPKPRMTEKSAATRLPTPPQDEPDRIRLSEGSRDESDARSVDGLVGLDGHEHDMAPLSDAEELNYSIFSSKQSLPNSSKKKSAPQSRIRSPPISASARATTRKLSQLYPSVDDMVEVEVDMREKSPPISVPGAFVLDNDENDNENDNNGGNQYRRQEVTNVPLRSSNRTTATGTSGRRSAAAPPPPTPRRSTRKRAASPGESVKISIPGALIEEQDDDDEEDHEMDHEEEDDDDAGPAAHTRAHAHAHAHTSTSNRRRTRGAGSDDEDHDEDNDDEGTEIDSVAPLPSTHRTRRRGAGSGSTNPSPVKGRSGVRGSNVSRAGSLEPDGHGHLRRSTRLTASMHASVSPVEENERRHGAGATGGLSASSSAAGGAYESGHHVAGGGGSTRPRKSTRMSGAGATATGRGAAKRR